MCLSFKIFNLCNLSMTNTRSERLKHDNKARTRRHALKEMIKRQEENEFSRLRKLKLKKNKAKRRQSH
jgi:hypothetical protein